MKSNRYIKEYTEKEKSLLRRLNSPKKIQDYINTLPINFEKDGDTFRSPRKVMKLKTAQCMEGALFSAAALEFHGHKPLIMDLKATDYDFDHVVAVFKQDGYFGAISKTNHAVLRYREPIYKTIRELALSFFHEYFNDRGIKNLRSYSRLLDLNHFNNLNWRISEKDLFEIPEYLDKTKHFNILSKRQIKNLRKADEIEIKAGKLVEWKKKI